jgi:hypothetical protein
MRWLSAHVVKRKGGLVSNNPVGRQSTELVAQALQWHPKMEQRSAVVGHNKIGTRQEMVCVDPTRAKTDYSA